MGHWELALPSQRFFCSEQLARVFGAGPELAARATVADFARRICEIDRAQVQAAWQAALQGQPYQMH